MRHSFISYFIIYFRHVSNICLNRKLQPLTSSSNYNTSLRTSHVDSPLSSYAQIQPPLTSPTADFSLSNICSQSSSSSPLTSSESHNFSKSSSTALKIQISTSKPFKLIITFNYMLFFYFRTLTTIYYYRRRIITRTFNFKRTNITCSNRFGRSILSQHCRYFTDARSEKQIIN